MLQSCGLAPAPHPEGNLFPAAWNRSTRTWCVPHNNQTHMSFDAPPAGSLASERTTMEQSGGGHIESAIRKVWHHRFNWDPSLPFSLVFRLPVPQSLSALIRTLGLATCLSWNVLIDHICRRRAALSEWCSVYSCLKSRRRCVPQQASMLSVCCYGQHDRLIIEIPHWWLGGRNTIKYAKMFGWGGRFQVETKTYSLVN